MNKLSRFYIFLIPLSTLLCTLFLVGFAYPSSPSRVSVTLCYKNYSITYKDEIVKPTNHLVAEEIFNRKINAPYAQKMNQVDICLYAGADCKTALLYCFPLLEKTVNAAIKKINAAPIDSEISFFPDKQQMFCITKQKEGASVDERVLYQNIYFALRRAASVKVAIAPKILMPKISYEDNQRITALRARFCTYYGTSGEGRRHNIELALKRINGKVLTPREEFSFNKIAGKRTQANGYKQAIIIKQGQYVEGVGGGVCQASTTVYNCALLADLKITSVRNHSLEPSYVWPSFDAMVSGATDLKFRNDDDRPVFIKARGDGKNAIVEIYGSPLPYKILRRSEELSREEPPEDKLVIDNDYQYFDKDALVPTGTQKRVWHGKGQLKSTGYLIYYSHDGRFIQKKQIRNDIYNRTNGLVAVAP